MEATGVLNAVKLSEGRCQSESTRPKQQHITKSEATVAYNSHQSSVSDENGSGLELNPFQDPEVAERWIATYEEAKYECRHVFDPTITWSEEEEKRVIRKLDLRVCLWAVRQSLLWPVFGIHLGLYISD